MELWIRIKQMGFILKIERSVKSSRLLGNDIQTILGAKALGLHLWWGGGGGWQAWRTSHACIGTILK